MSLVDSLKLYSLYSIGAVISVVILSLIVGRRVKAITIILLYPILSLISILVLITIKTPVVAAIMSFMLGVTLAGVLQLGLSILCEFFWDRKGRMTGVMYSATALATAVVPLITGYITRLYDIQGVFTFMIIINAIGIFVSAIVNYRYRILAKPDHRLDMDEFDYQAESSKAI
ncbi:MFS transporter [Bacillus sp. B15-48]|uniref:MFS transporter n=1 Tax=Bacillus sp. B15-48 TaxID=1548601 RepID=UPI00193EF65E|nr:MFS transporter [Bacillus sp. B15-48]